LGEIEYEHPGSPTQPARLVTQTLRAAELELKPPSRSDRALLAVTLTVIVAREENPPQGCEPIEWLLVTTLPATTLEQAAEKLQWYLCRWQIDIDQPYYLRKRVINRLICFFNDLIRPRALGRTQFA